MAARRHLWRGCQGATLAWALCVAPAQAQVRETAPPPAQWPATLAMAAPSPSPTPAPLQPLPAGVELGMGADALREAVPSAARVPRPQRLAGGLAGLWRLEPVVIAGLSGAQTFFFGGRELRRVEFVADASDLADGGAAAFGALLAFGRSTYGPETAANDPSGTYAAWTSGGLELYAQRVPAPRATVRWVIKQSEGKDASEL
ncbi:hypothetical protein C8C99_4569 [Acidovorax sp. 107]|nr:hypothetical protein C8C99_4569 [Acidovorax sp. 107]